MSDLANENARATDGATRHLATDLTPFLAAARASAPDALEPLLHHIAAGPSAAESRPGTEYLLMACADVACAVPLTALREVLPSLPQTVPLPYSPPWMLGIFPLRSEMLGLVDPAPLLLGSPLSSEVNWSMSQAGISAPPARQRRSPFAPGLSLTPALIVGNEEVSLAWAIGGIGEIARAQDDELHFDIGDTASLMGTPAPFREQYIAGIYAPSHSDARYVVLHVERLLADLVRALEESEEPYG